MNPELFDLAVNLSGLESDTEHSQSDDREKEDLACAPLQEVAQLTQLILQPCPDPNRRSLTFRFALKNKASETLDYRDQHQYIINMLNE